MVSASRKESLAWLAWSLAGAVSLAAVLAPGSPIGQKVREALPALGTSSPIPFPLPRPFAPAPPAPPPPEGPALAPSSTDASSSPREIAPVAPFAAKIASVAPGTATTTAAAAAIPVQIAVGAISVGVSTTPARPSSLQANATIPGVDVQAVVSFG